MTLLELTEPLFQYICRLNRVARKSGPAAAGDTAFLTKGAAASRGVSLDYAVVRSEVKSMVEEMQQKAAKDYRLSSQIKKMELPLIFFVDSMISESALKFAAQWNQNRWAYERNEMAGDDKFFILLDEDMKDNSEEASERLAVFYTCIGLGFSGSLFDQPELLRNKMFSMGPRIRRYIDADEAAKICPDAYEAVDTRDLTEPPSRTVVVVGLIFVCLTAASLISYLYLYHVSKRDLNESLDKITAKDPARK
jgi:type VI protein secretion system component VasF